MSQFPLINDQQNCGTVSGAVPEITAGVVLREFQEENRKVR